MTVTLESAACARAQNPTVSPIGQAIDEFEAELSATSDEYRRLQEEYGLLQEIARQVILFRSLTHMTQKQLAGLVGTSYSQISRIESGMHKPNVDTLQRLARVLGRKLIVRFEELDAAAPQVPDLTNQLRSYTTLSQKSAPEPASLDVDAQIRFTPTRSVQQATNHREMITAETAERPYAMAS